MESMEVSRRQGDALMLPRSSQQDLGATEEGSGSPAGNKDGKGAALPGRSAGEKRKAAGAAGEEGCPWMLMGLLCGP